MMAAAGVERQRSLENPLISSKKLTSASRQASVAASGQLQSLTNTVNTGRPSNTTSLRVTGQSRSLLSSGDLTPHTSALHQAKGSQAGGSGVDKTSRNALLSSSVSSSSRLLSSSARNSLLFANLSTSSTRELTSTLPLTNSQRPTSTVGQRPAQLLSSPPMVNTSPTMTVNTASKTVRVNTASKTARVNTASKPVRVNTASKTMVNSTSNSLLFSSTRSSQLTKPTFLTSSSSKISPVKLFSSSQLTLPTTSSLSIRPLLPGKLSPSPPDKDTTSNTRHKKLVEKPAVREGDTRPPVYKFQSEVISVEQGGNFLPPELDASVQGPLAPVGEVVQLKITLVNAVATSLLCSPDFKSSSDPTRRSLVELGEHLSSRDPEFILKVALYTRNDLNIRTTANFLLALASNIPACRPFLRKYFCASTRLPSDWIEVAEIYQAFHDKSLNFGSLPTALRKVMAAKFVEFDVYQLGKYNKDKSKKKKDGKGKEKSKQDGGRKEADAVPAGGGDTGGDTEREEEEGPPQRSDTNTTAESSEVIVVSDTETEEEVKRLSFTLKQLIRKIHISEPVEPVMCLLGKKYPEDPESFCCSCLPGTWDNTRAGKRMKLATPETWETTVSMKGNKSHVWEDLIDHNKLPFMAMLRNIRNLILADVSQRHHRWVLSKLNDERAVINSRQFPFRFFSAYEVLNELEKYSDEEMVPTNKKEQLLKKKFRKFLSIIDTALLRRYRTALDNALKIATYYNVKPISGSTLILCNVGSNMDRPCTAARGLGKPRTVLEVGVLLGLMCKYVCEQCSLVLYGEKAHVQVQLKEGTILHNMEHVMSTISTHSLMSSCGVIPSQLLYEMLINRTPVDNLVLLTDAMKLDDPQGQKMMDFLKKYRQLVNPNLLFVSVDLSGRSSGVSSTIRPQHKNDIYLAGYSDQILRFIAERGDSGQLTYVDNIDKAYNLKQLPQSALLSPTQTPPTSLGAEKALLASTKRQKWRTVRVFISSTFRDMHGERDLLTRFVFPELRALAHSKQIQLYEVDLRWGVTEEDARHQRALEICLNEISRCSYFIGLLGERYGWVLDSYDVSSPELEWLGDLPPGHSITHIEMQHACLRDPDKAHGKAFFYFRDPAMNDAIPDQHLADFESESKEKKEKIEQLKSDIRTSGLEVYDGYPSRWLGVVEGKAMVGGLEDFGQRVLHNLWNAIKRDFPDNETGFDPVTEAAIAHNAFADNRVSSFVGRKSILKKAQEMVGSVPEGVVVIEGKPGSGKSAFMAALAQQCSVASSSDLVLTHFLGAAPSSTNIASILTRLCHELNRRFNLQRDVPSDYTELLKSWPEFLEDSSATVGRSQLMIFIDGLDLLEEKHNARALDWIPEKLPAGVVMALSVVERGQTAANLKKRLPSPATLTVGKMNEWDKADMVREKLARHRKSLDESPFNNQMKLLLSKRDATNPLFLHLACEELRVFGVFEEVSSHLKSLPPTLPNLLQDVLARIEGEVGVEIISVSLSLLCLVRNGLKECELSAIVSLYLASKLKEEEGASIMPPLTLSRLLRCLWSFLQPTDQDSSDLLTLAHTDIEVAVRQRYMKGRGEKEKYYHTLLASYFQSEADPDGDRTYKSNNVRAFDELPHHLMMAGLWQQLEETVCNINFVISKCRLGSAQNLLEDYTPNLEGISSGKAREYSKYVNGSRVVIFRSFVSRNLHVLATTPALALQQAVNEPSQSLVAEEAEKALQASPQPLVRWMNRPPGEDPCRMTIPHSSEVTCVTVSADSSQFAAGFKNCSVRLYSVATGHELQSFIGHAAEVTGVCFVGSHALCSASHDTNLSLWDLKGGFRKATMKSHTRSVRGCAADVGGKVIVSVSWDTNIRVWNGQTGKNVCSLATRGGRNCPLNCVTFHPTSDQLIAVGSWDGSVRVWDTFNQKRVKVLKGHQTSVQACVYAPSGRYLVSAALDGEVKVWSTKSGTVVGNIVGHSDPVNALSFSPSGQYLITGSSDQLVKVWSGGLGQQVVRVGRSEFGYAHRVTHNRARKTVLVGYHDGHTRQFNTQTEQEMFAVRLHQKAVVGVGSWENFNMSASADGTIKIWEGPSSLPRHMLLEGHKAGITCAVWGRNGLASAAEDFSILLWPHDVTHFTHLWTRAQGAVKVSVYPLISLRGHTATISALSFSADGLKMASASHDRSVIIWDRLNKKEERTMRDCHKDWITACAFSDSSSDTLITASNDFNLKLWNVKTGKERITFRGHTSAINSVSFSRGCVVSSAFDGSVKVWTHKGVEISTLHCHKQRVNACLLDLPRRTESSSWADIMEEEEEEEEKEGRQQKNKLADVLVITASDDGTVGVWRPFIPNNVATLVGHSDRVLAAMATLNNEIITTSRDKTIRIWSPSLPNNMGRVSLTSSAHGHTGEVTAITVSSQFIATAGRDGCLLIWTLTAGQEDKKNCGHSTLHKMYTVTDSKRAITSLTFVGSVSKSGVVSLAVGRDSGSVVLYRFSETEFPSETTVLDCDTLMGAHPISGLAHTPGSHLILVSSWSGVVTATSGTGKTVERMDVHSKWVMGVIGVRRGRDVYAYSVGLDRVLCKWSLYHYSQKQSGQSALVTAVCIPDVVEGGKKRDDWLLCLCELSATYIAIGDSGGRVWLRNQDSLRTGFSKKLHKCAITAVAAVQDSMLATASQDGTIKIWRLTSQPDLVQVGHFHAQASVTSLTTTAGGGGGGGGDGEKLPVLLAGDCLGHVMALEWSHST